MPRTKEIYTLFALTGNRDSPLANQMHACAARSVGRSAALIQRIHITAAHSIRTN